MTTASALFVSALLLALAVPAKQDLALLVGVLVLAAVGLIETRRRLAPVLLS